MTDDGGQTTDGRWTDCHVGQKLMRMMETLTSRGQMTYGQWTDGRWTDLRWMVDRQQMDNGQISDGR